MPILSVVGAPSWASGTCLPLDLKCALGKLLGRNAPPEAQHVQSYAAFMKALAARYPLAWLETWNEPNEAYQWGGRAPQPDVMGRMQCAAYDAIKSAYPNRKVLGPGIGGAVQEHGAETMSYGTFVKGMYAATGRICWNLISVHLYFGVGYDGPDTQLARQMLMIRQTKAATGDSSKILVTETGASTSNPKYPFSHEKQTRAQTNGVHKLLTMWDISGVLVHSLRDGNTLENNQNEKASDYGFGVLGRSLSAKPGYCHWVKLNGKTYPGC